jgi:hypothetical protein
MDCSNGWSESGTRSELLGFITRRTEIPREVLSGEDVRKCSVAERMSWASDRTTTRIEDMACCLLGIFDVNWPLLYGEGSKAFILPQAGSSWRSIARVFAYAEQEEIMKESDDQTLFAWQIGHDKSVYGDGCGVRGPHPSHFRKS